MPSPAEDNRQLAAIVFTDVVGYSARMQEDETRTLALVRADFEHMRRLCAKHRGKVLNTMGDGMLLCFPTAVQAVTFALQMQWEYGRRRAARPAAEALEHRIGIHVGDIVQHEGQVAGNGVNIAARLQTAALPGGICASQTAYDMVRGRIALHAEPLGPQEFKNIETVSVYHLAPAGGVTGRRPKVSLRVSRRALLSAACLVFAALLGGAGWWFLFGRATGADKSIAVLPFANLSADPQNAFFADGMHGDIIASLGKISDLKVISRTSVLPFRDGQNRNLPQIARELNVRTVLEGTVQRTADRVKITVALYDARKDQRLWGDEYERPVNDVFAIQSELAEVIAAQLQANFASAERSLIAQRPTQNAAAYDFYLQARVLGDNLSGSGRENYERVSELYERAIASDPAFALAHVQLSVLHGVMYWWGGLDPSPERRERARLALEAAERLAPNAPETKIARGSYAYRCDNDWSAALAAFRAAQSELPNDAQLLTNIGATERRLGRWTEALEHLARAVALSPRDFSSIDTLLNTCLWLRRYAEVRELARQYLATFPNDRTLIGYDIAAQLALEGSEAVHAARLAGLPPLPGEAGAARASYEAAMAAHDFAAAERALADPRLTSLPGPGGVVSEPVTLSRALVALLRSDAPAARINATEAENRLRAQTWTRRQEPMGKMALARAKAYSGDAETALREAAAAVAEAGTRDAFDAVLLRIELARLQSLLRRPEAALATLKDLMQSPCPVSANAFRADPAFTALKPDPRFEEVLKAAKPL